MGINEGEWLKILYGNEFLSEQIGNFGTKLSMKIGLGSEVKPRQLIKGGHGVNSSTVTFIKELLE